MICMLSTHIDKVLYAWNTHNAGRCSERRAQSNGLLAGICGHKVRYSAQPEPWHAGSLVQPCNTEYAQICHIQAGGGRVRDSSHMSSTQLAGMYASMV